MPDGLLYLDSCGDHYGTSEITLKWRAFTVSGLTASVVSGGRTGNCLFLGQLGGLSGGLARNIKAQSTKLVIGGAFKFASTGTGVPNSSRMILCGNLVGSAYASCAFNGAGVPEVYGPGSTRLALDTSGFFVHPDVWYYVELVVLISWTTPNYTLVLDEVSMYVDGRLAAQSLNYNTGLQLGAQYPMGVFAMGGVGSDTFLDDVYVSNDRRWGNAKVAIRRPNAEGDLADWSPDSGSVHYSRISDTTPDGDSSYISAGSVGDQDISHMQDIISSNVEIKGLQHVLSMKQDVEGVRGIKTLVKVNGTVYQIDLEHFINLSYLYYLTPFEFNPDTGLDWTVSEFNGAQFGQEITT